VAFPYFGGVENEHFTANPMQDVLVRNVPTRTLKLGGKDVHVATVFDLLAANYGVDRGLGGDHLGATYDDNAPYTPAWQESITGVSRHAVIRLAREFAENAHKTRGKSMVIIGAAMNHWYHSDMNYRGVINMLMMCGCVGQSGGGWATTSARRSCVRRPAGCRWPSPPTGSARHGSRTRRASSTRTPTSGATRS